MLDTSNLQRYQQARLSRDARFDGKFFVAVKTTGIYCRPICPARVPKEENVEYFTHAHQAAQNGYRPCLRCRPDSAPGSPMWKGVDTTLERAKRLIDEGALEHGDLVALSARLGITDRYLRKIFDQYLGISPKSYALFRQCEFAKNLLHQTTLSITDIAFASGFNSIRRFNDCFKKQLLMSPSQIRKQKSTTNNAVSLKLYYRPPYHWQHLQAFFAARMIEGLEWVDEKSYGRTYTWQTPQGSCKGEFTATHNKKQHRFDVQIEIDNVHLLKPVVANIRRLLDLDTDSETVDQCLKFAGFYHTISGLRLPGIWSVFEAGIRAILGQQISVVAARNLVKRTTDELGEKKIGTKASNNKLYFPTLNSIAASDFSFIKIPGRRKQTLSDLARHHLDHSVFDNSADPNDWLAIKGIGPWTTDYAKMRGLSDPDIYLGGDLGVKKALKNSMKTEQDGFNMQDVQAAAPFRSYLTFQLWNTLS